MRSKKWVSRLSVFPILLATVIFGLRLLEDAHASLEEPAQLAEVGRSAGLEKGFNQAWIHDHYGSQWGARFDAAEWERLLQRTKNAGATIFRIWIFEGTHLLRDHGNPERRGEFSIHPLYLKNLREAVRLSKKFGVRLYLTLFDGNASTWASDEENALLAQVLDPHSEEHQAFLAGFVAPLANIIAENPEAFYGVDLVNEINVFIRDRRFPAGQSGLRSWISSLRSAFRLPPTVKLFASLGHHDAVSYITSGRLPVDLLDGIDIHLYNDRGAIEECASLREISRQAGKPWILGELGQSSKSFDDALQARVLERFVASARQCGAAAVLPWRLSDIRQGHNPEARLSFESYGKPRPAYDVFRSL
jgi:hypothetical protein